MRRMKSLSVIISGRFAHYSDAILSCGVLFESDINDCALENCLIGHNGFISLIDENGRDHSLPLDGGGWGEGE
jgi:hypothetical protein